MSKLCIPNIQSVGSPLEVLSWAVIQNLNKLIKSWGESETEQLSGLLAVHGWSVPCKGTSRSGLSSQKHLIDLEHHEALPNSKQHPSAKNAINSANTKEVCICALTCTCKLVCACALVCRDGRIWRIWGWMGCRKKK